MKTTRSLLTIATLSTAFVSLPACTKSDPVEQAAANARTAARDLADEVRTAASDSWDNVKDYSYDKRNDLAASLSRMANRHDADINAASAKLIGLPDEAAKARDQAVKEFRAAHARLKDQLADLRTGSSDTWNASKAKVERSWLRLQAAYEKAKASSTS